MDEVFTCHRDDDSKRFLASREPTIKADIDPGGELKPDHYLPKKRHYAKSVLRPGRDNRGLSDK